jgi:hypothetical protein
MFRRTALVAVFAVLGLALLAAKDPKQDPEDREGRSRILAGLKEPVQLVEGYQKWAMLTDGPVDVAEGAFFACGLNWSGDEKREVSPRENQGVHWSSAIRVYANPLAKTAIEEKKANFPQGSILIKEKIYFGEIIAITAMIREKDDYDYSEEKNNWRYFYIDRRNEMQFGRIENCRKCHQKAAETDFAFLKYTDTPGYSRGP